MKTLILLFAFTAGFVAAQDSEAASKEMCDKVEEAVMAYNTAWILSDVISVNFKGADLKEIQANVASNKALQERMIKVFTKINCK